MPAAYAELVRTCYERSRLVRTLRRGVSGGGEPQSAQRSELEVEAAGRRGVVWITVRSAGSDLARAVAAHLAADGPTQVDLSLADPLTPAATGQLRGIGFFFGALLPEFHQGDVLRMQQLPRRLREDEAPVLESDALRAVADFVTRDGAEVLRMAADPD